MILSAAMMLEWLGLKADNQQMIKDAQRLRDAVDAVVVDGKKTTRDLGGSSNTTQAGEAVMEQL